MKKTMIFNLFFLFIIPLIITQNVITSWNYDKVQMFDMEKIEYTLKNKLIESVGKIPDFQEGNIEITNITFNEVVVGLYDSFVDYKKGLFLLSPQKVILSFTFDYKENGEENKNALLEINVHTLKINFSTNRLTQISNVESSFIFYQNNFKLFQIKDSSKIDELQAALFNGFIHNNILNGMISTSINTIILEYYINKYGSKNNYSFKLSKFFDSNEYTLAMNRFIGFCDDPNKKYKTAVCYYSCELFEDKTDKSSVPLNNPDFTNNPESYNLFINHILIDQILKDVLNKGLSTKYIQEEMYTEEKKKTLGYNFTVASLKEYFRGLDNYDSSLKFNMNISIVQMDFERAEFIIGFNINEEVNVFSIKAIVDYVHEFKIIKNAEFNLCLLTPECSFVTMYKDAGVTIRDIPKLKQAVTNSFFLEKYPICLSQKGITMKDYYSKITNGYTKNEGIYIEGEQLYQ